MDSEVTLPGFRHQCAVRVRWGDEDALGHVNNAKFLTYMEEGRIQYVNDLKLWAGDRSRLGMILARIEVDFRLPLFAGDELYVFTRATHFGRSSFKIDQWITRHKDNQLEIAAQGVLTIVVYDYELGKSAPIPDEWRAIIKAYEIAPPQE